MDVFLLDFTFSHDPEPSMNRHHFRGELLFAGWPRPQRRPLLVLSREYPTTPRSGRDHRQHLQLPQPLRWQVIVGGNPLRQQAVVDAPEAPRARPACCAHGIPSPDINPAFRNITLTSGLRILKRSEPDLVETVFSTHSSAVKQRWAIELYRCAHLRHHHHRPHQATPPKAFIASAPPDALTCAVGNRRVTVARIAPTPLCMY